MKYQILWIDDQPNDKFIIEAEDYDLDIHVETCYNDGIEWLRTNLDNCYAVILDVKCKITNDPKEVARREAFKEKWLDVVQLCSQRKQIPWFVYTAGDYEGIEALQVMIPSRQFYNKPDDRVELFKNIVQAIELNDMAIAVKKYGDVLNFYYSLQDSDDIVKPLFRVIKIVEENDYKNTSAFNDMRKALGWCVAYMREHGIFPQELTRMSSATYYLNNINDTNFCRKRNVKPRKDIVPDYIRYSFEICEDICNNGSHGKMEGSTDDTNNLIVDSIVSKGNAPYLIRSTFYELMNILDWCKKLPTSEEEIAQYREAIANLNIQFDPTK
jgi:hypothetical protein